jgi:hypothetical protein
MACPNLTDEEIKTTVIAAVKTYHPGHTIDEDTNFASDLGEEGKAKRKYFALIRKDVMDDGCQFKASVGSFDKCKTVKDMIAATQKAVTC